MTKLNLVILPVLAALSACGCALPGEPGKWSVVSWNVQNLFDGVDDGDEYPEFDPGTGTWNERLYLRRLERCGEVLSACVSGYPDLIVLQELEKTSVLDDLADGVLRTAGYRWRVAVPGYGIIRCGVLSRYPVREVHVADCGTGPERALRPVLSFTVDTPGGPLLVAAAHWKSPRDGREATEEARRREARETWRVLEPALAADAGAQLLIIGDLNTPGDGIPFPSALAPWDPYSEVREGNVLYRTEFAEGAGLREGCPVFFDPEPDGMAGGTYWFQGGWDRPDHALLSSGLTGPPGLVFEACRIGAEQVMGGMDVHPVPWRTDLEEGYSDHLPLVLEFRVASGPQDKPD